MLQVARRLESEMSDGSLKEQTSPAEPFVALLPRRIFVRYLLVKRSRPDESEFLHADILYMSPNIAPPFELLRVKHSIHVSSSLKDNAPLQIQGWQGDKALIEGTISSIVQGWRGGVAGDDNWGNTWAESKEFVGVLKMLDAGIKERELPESSPHFMLYHGSLAARLAGYVNALGHLVVLDNSVRQRAETMRRMSDRFDAFVAKSRLALGARLLDE